MPTFRTLQYFTLFVRLGVSTRTLYRSRHCQTSVKPRQVNNVEISCRNRVNIMIPRWSLPTGVQASQAPTRFVWRGASKVHNGCNSWKYFIGRTAFPVPTRFLSFYETFRREFTFPSNSHHDIDLVLLYTRKVSTRAWLWQVNTFNAWYYPPRWADVRQSLYNQPHVCIHMTWTPTDVSPRRTCCPLFCPAGAEYVSTIPLYIQVSSCTFHYPPC